MSTPVVVCVCARARTCEREMDGRMCLKSCVCVCARARERALYVRACMRMHVGAFVCVQDGLDKVSVVTDWKP